jgi:hypothetical protein
MTTSIIQQIRVGGLPGPYTLRFEPFHVHKPLLSEGNPVGLTVTAGPRPGPLPTVTVRHSCEWHQNWT